MGEAMEDEEREARTKRIMARGLDRTAFITASPSTPTLHSRTQSSFGNLEKTTDEFCTRRRQKCYSDSETRFRHNEQPSVPKPTDHPQPVQKGSCPNHLNLFSLKDINACILTSENARLQCSIMIALLVVVSCVSVPHGMTKSNSIIASRPLYILILTDVSIVVARLLILGKQEDPETAKKEEKEEGGHKEDDDEYNWTEAFAVLEIGLVIYQTIRALFIDCSFYLVVALCGLSML